MSLYQRSSMVPQSRVTNEHHHTIQHLERYFTRASSSRTPSLISRTEM